jgi:hypothetical protein
LSREIPVGPERRRCSAVRKATPEASLAREAAGLRAVCQNPRTYGHTLHGNREVLGLTWPLAGSVA